MGWILVGHCRMARDVSLEDLPFPVTKVPRYEFSTLQVLAAGLPMAAPCMCDQMK
ncbi:hypothetical protein [Roseobacter sp.]|uniref:hypothetical protein n=1 Tax=Roseobacter sp. TaxID=1907202 RepID=UPI002966183B|nr:hypothetical protein [Roseobacter sp.]MDW3182866.1 hypothetical protein [Roseobacter sp.]